MSISSTKRHAVRAVAAGAACIALALVPATGAAAATATEASDSPPAESELKVETMYYGGIDDAQAAKVGNMVRYKGDRKLLIDGSSGEVLIDIPADPAVAKQEAIAESEKSAMPSNYRNVMYGACGYSYLWLQDAAGSANYRFLTGFELYSNAYDFGWEVFVSAEGLGFDWSDFGPM